MTLAIIKWLARVPVAMFANLVGYFAAPFVVPFASPEGWLPRRLSWFQTPDYSLDGDWGWTFEHWQFRGKLPFWLAEYVGRVGWLWRNNMYGFDIDVLGAVAQPGHVFEIKGDPRVSNRPLVEGLVIRTITNPDGKVYFQLYYVKAWSEKHCLRINLGWKLWNIREGVSNQMVVSINPWMGYMRAKI